MTEARLTEELVQAIEADFDILREVAGYHHIYKKNVRVDLMLRAKPHLQLEGFTDEWFGVECKWSGTVHGATSKATRLMWQSITYAQSIFEVNGESVMPAFVAVYTSRDLPVVIENHLGKLLELGLYGNVGRLYLYKDRSWGIKFASIYARSIDGGYKVKESQLPARRAGSV